MKRLLVLVLVLVLMLGGMTAIAEMAPSAYMTSRGYMVLDSNQLSDLGVDTSALANAADINFAAYLYNDPTFGNLIIWFKDRVVYATVNLTALLGGTPTAGGMLEVFIDFCRSFDFDIYMVGGPDVLYYHPASIKGYTYGSNLQNVGEKKMYWTMDGFIDTIRDEVK